MVFGSPFPELLLVVKTIFVYKELHSFFFSSLSHNFVVCFTNSWEPPNLTSAVTIETTATQVVVCPGFFSVTGTEFGPLPCLPQHTLMRNTFISSAWGRGYFLGICLEYDFSLVPQSSQPSPTSLLHSHRF